MYSKAPKPKFRIFRLIGHLFFCSSVVLLLTVRDACAYIDPGSGALILQALIAACFGALFYFRSFIRRVINRVYHPKRKLTEKQK